MSGLIRRTLERMPLLRPVVRLAVERRVRRAVRAAGCQVEISPMAIDVVRGTQRVRLNPKHLMFAPDVAVHFDAYWSSVSPASGTSMVDFSAPARHHIPALAADLWQSGLVEEVDTIQGYLKHAPPRNGETVFDLGSNCGVSVYVFRRRSDRRGTSSRSSRIRSIARCSRGT